ncbi:MAG: DUF5060 domain-containing protein, partial [Phycisphaerae bacterium]|nr:DUF5060 domain-containing protein [Phycisphaerae bacterium]
MSTALSKFRAFLRKRTDTSQAVAGAAVLPCCETLEPRLMLDATGPSSAELFEYAEWHVDNPSYSGNAFDVIADVDFTHAGSGETITTQMFYDGNDDWKFRFTGTETGTWNYTTSSSDGDLDGLTGSISINPNSDPEALGFLVAAGQKYAWQVGNDGDLRAIPKITYARNPETWFWGKDNSPTNNLNSYFAPALDEASNLGYDTWWTNMRHAWFQWDAWSWNDHNNVNPDLTVFRMLDNHIQDVHDRGLALDIRMWGDSAHAWSAEGLPGGINGEVDQRLQRYIAARLGALPGWGLSYGYDLEEFMTESSVNTWATYMNDHMAWPHLIWARRFYSSVTVASNDDRPSDANDCYNDAISRFNEAANDGRPVLFERNFDDSRWSHDRVRRGMWAFAMAGGAAAHYTDQVAPDVDTFGEFWNGHERLLLDMQPNNGLSNDSDTWVIESPSQQSLVAYRRGNASSIQLNLSGYGGSRAAVAVDTKSDYSEVDLGVLSASNQTVDLPYSSEWAIAVGDFGDTPDDTTPPTQVDGLSANAVSASQIDLTWNAASDPESGVSSYNVYRDGAQVANVGGTSYSDTGLSAETTYTYEIAAVNGAGLEGAKSSPVSETTDSVTLRPPDNPADAVAGIEYEVFDGSWSSLPDFDSLTAVETGVMDVIDLTPERDGTDNFAMRWTGYVEVPTDATYTFYTASDDGSQLFIGETMVVDNDGLHGVQERSGTIGLEAGQHAMTVTFFEKTGGEAIDVRFEGGGLSKQEIPAGNLFYVGEGNQNPVAADDSAGTTEGTPVTIDVLGNDSDPDGDPLTVDSVTQGSNGSVTNNG